MPRSLRDSESCSVQLQPHANANLRNKWSMQLLFIGLNSMHTRELNPKAEYCTRYRQRYAL